MTEVEAAVLPRAVEPGRIFAGKYRVERVLGQGAAGTVIAATHTGTGRLVAIKCLHGDLAHIPEASGRLLREAQLTGLIRHPNIVDIFDVGTHDGAVYLVMEYLRGQPLSAFIGGGPLRIGTAARTLACAMQGVAAAHAAGVVHRDLKPDNIFVCAGDPEDDSRIKVLDFGVSKFARTEPGSAEVSLTITGAMVGTPHYMAPEQIRDSRSVDHRADVYALGMVLYEALGGTRPFTAETLGALLLAIMQDELPSLGTVRTGLPEGLISLVARAVAKDPEKRFQSVEEMLEALMPFSDGPALVGWDAHASLPPPPTARSQSAPHLPAGSDADSDNPTAALSSLLSANDTRTAFSRHVREHHRLGALTALATLTACAIALLVWLLSRTDDPRDALIVEPSVTAAAPDPSSEPQSGREPQVVPVEPRHTVSAEPRKKPADRATARPRRERPLPPNPTPRQPAAPRASSPLVRARSGVQVHPDEF